MLPARILAKIRIPEDPDACWPWLAATSPAGYGRTYWNGNTREAHRVVYSILVGEVPEGMVLDHACHDPFICRKTDRECPHRRCQNPAHLTVVTRGANALRSFSPPALNAYSDRCDKGHLYEPGTYTETEGHRRCLICRRETDKRRRPRGIQRPDRPRSGIKEFRPWGDTPERRARDAEIVRLRSGGMTFDAIATELGISRSFASAQYNRVRGLASVAEEKAAAREARQARVRELVASGQSVGQIMAALSISRATVFRDLAA